MFPRIITWVSAYLASYKQGKERESLSDCEGDWQGPTTQYPTEDTAWLGLWSQEA